MGAWQDRDEDWSVDFDAWQRELDGHRPHAWMVLLMSLYDVCVWQERLCERRQGDGLPAPVLALPRKADMYLVYGLRKAPADFSRDVDQTRSWLMRKQVLRKSLFRGSVPESGADEVVRCAEVVSLAVGALSEVWPGLREIAEGHVGARAADVLGGAATTERRLDALELIRARDGVALAVDRLSPDLPPTWRAVGDGMTRQAVLEAPSSTLAKGVDATYARVMQLASLSRAVCSPPCLLRLLDLLEERGYARELDGDFPEGGYLSFAGVSADFALGDIARRAARRDSHANATLTASVACALATLSVVGPLQLAELRMRVGTSPGLAMLRPYFEALERVESEPAPITAIPGVERAPGRRQVALLLAQVAYESYEGPLDARGGVAPVHEPIPLVEGRVYYLGREVAEANFADEGERARFVDDERAGRAVALTIHPATKTAVGRVHARVLYDRQAGGWVLQALGNRSSTQAVSARTLVIDPNDRVLDATLVRAAWAGKAHDRTVRPSSGHPSARLRASSVLWLGPKVVQGDDGSAWWAPDEARGAVFVVRGA